MERSSIAQNIPSKFVSWRHHYSSIAVIVMEDKNVPATEEEVPAATNQLPVDCKVSWFVCVCLSLANFICVGSCYIYGIFFPTLLEEFKAGKALTALPGSMSVGFLCLLSPICSFLTKRFGARFTLPCGSALCGLGLLTSSFATNIYTVSLTYGFIFACGSCVIYMASFMTVPLYFNKHRSLAIGMVSAGPAAGFLLISPISQSLLEYLGWRKAMLCLGGINLIPCFLGFGITRKVNNRRVGPASGSPRIKTALSDILSSLKSSGPLLGLMSVMTFVIGFGQQMPIVHLIKYADEIGIPSHESSWMYPIKGILSTICNVATGKIGDTKRISFYHICQFGTILMALNNFLMPMSKKLGHLYAYAAVLGICEAAYYTSLCCLSIALNPEYGISLFFLVSSIPAVAGPAVAGLIADLSHSYIPVFYTAGSFYALITLIIFSRHCVRRHPRIEAVQCPMEQMQ